MIEVNGHKWETDAARTRRGRDVLCLTCTNCGDRTQVPMRSKKQQDYLLKQEPCIRTSIETTMVAAFLANGIKVFYPRLLGPKAKVVLVAMAAEGKVQLLESAYCQDGHEFWGGPMGTEFIAHCPECEDQETLEVAIEVRAHMTDQWAAQLQATLPQQHTGISMGCAVPVEVCPKCKKG